PLTVLETPLDIRDKNKKTIVRIESDPVPALWLVGAKGSVKLVVTETGGGVSIRTTNAVDPSALFYDGNGDGMLALVGKSGKRIAQLGKDGVSAFNDGANVIAR